MPKTINESATFSASAAGLFSVYTDSAQHAAVIGSRVEISPRVGSEFTAFDGNVRGKNLVVGEGTIIVESWRGSVWNEGDPSAS